MSEQEEEKKQASKRQAEAHKEVADLDEAKATRERGRPRKGTSGQSSQGGDEVAAVAPPVPTKKRETSGTSRARASFKKPSVATMAEALRQAQGVVCVAAAALGIGRTTMYRYLDEHAHLQEVLEDLRERELRAVELVVKRIIHQGETDRDRLNAARFYLERRGAKYGWGLSQQVDVTSGGEKVATPQVIVYLPDNGSEIPDDER